MLDASTALWSSTFHLFIILFEKKYLVMTLVHLAFMSLQECPLVPLQFMSNIIYVNVAYYVRTRTAAIDCIVS